MKNDFTNSIIKRFVLVSLMIITISFLSYTQLNATSQWSRKTGVACSHCHSVFPRLNPTGEKFLKNGYQLDKASDKNYPITAGGVLLDEISHLLGFRLNITPFMMETNSFQQDSASESSSRWTFGNPNWIQFFAAGSIYKDISFFTEMEHTTSGFKLNWFYFNFTNLFSTSYLNLQVGNISPMEFASFPNRLPQLPALKGEVMLKKSSNGSGENSVDMSSARPGIQYFGYNDYATLYLGISPGTKGTSVNQFLNMWGGLVLNLPESVSKDFEGTSVTLHYYKGTDTKNTGTQTPVELPQIENNFTRISPQLNVRYKGVFDLQAAYVMAEDDNWSLAATKPADKFKYSGMAVEAGYMPYEDWHFAVHYDKYNSDDKNPNGKYIFEYQRVVPVVTYIINQNIRMSLYYEKDLSDKDAKLLVDKFSMNVRVMF